MFPGTEIPSVPAKPLSDAGPTASAKDKKKLAEGRKPAKKKFIERNAKTFVDLCAYPIDEELVFDFRTQPLFFATGRFSHLQDNVGPLKKYIEQFVNDLEERSEGDENDFHRGPNLVGLPEVTAVRNMSPLSPFHLLRFHFVVRAATALERGSITEITAGPSTRDGFSSETIFPSIWITDPAVLNNLLKTLPASAKSTAVDVLRNEHGSQALPNLFDDYLIAAETKPSNKKAKNGRNRGVAYGVTKPFANALYNVLRDLAAEAGSSMPTFDMLFKTDDADLQGLGLSYKALLKVEGNLLKLPETRDQKHQSADEKSETTGT